MLQIEQHSRAGMGTGTARTALLLAKLAPLLPVAVYAAMAPVFTGTLRLDLLFALAAAGLVGVLALHVALSRAVAPYEEASRLLEEGLDLSTLPPGGSQAERLSSAARLAVDRIEALSARIEKSALADELTGLPSRRAVLPQLKGALARARRTGEPFALALVELDGLKLVNELLGEEFGDAVLRDVGALLREELRASDVAARWSGDLFLLLLPATTVDAAVNVVDRLRLRLLERSLTIVDDDRVTFTSGVAGFQITDLHVEEITKRADEALAAARRAGSNRVMALDSERFHEI